MGGGLGGAYAAFGLGSIAFLGPVGAVIGVAVGGFVSVLLRASLDSEAAVACEKAIEAGLLVMTVQAHTGDEVHIEALLGDRVIATEADSYR